MKKLKKFATLVLRLMPLASWAMTAAITVAAISSRSAVPTVLPVIGQTPAPLPSADARRCTRPGGAVDDGAPPGMAHFAGGSVIRRFDRGRLDSRRPCSDGDPVTAPLAVTGATGVVGGGVAQQLAARGIAQRLVVRSPHRAPTIAGAEVAGAAYGDAAAIREALEGIDTVFMVSAAENLDRVTEHLTFVDAAVAAGVRRIVYTSFLGAAADAVFLLGRDHWRTEEHIRDSGLAFTFLRDNLYADLMPEFAGPEGVIRGPAGVGRLSAVARADVIDVATEVLSAAATARSGPSPHDGVTYHLTGPEALTMAEMAAIITGATGRTVRFENETIEQAYASRAGDGAPDWQVDAWVSTYTAIAAGEMAEVRDDVEGVTGHPAINFRALLGG